MQFVPLQTYTDYSAYMNKDSISNINKNSNMIDNSLEVSKQKDSELKVEQVTDSKKLLNEKTVAFYFNHQAVQSSKTKMQMAMDYENSDDETQLTYKDIKEINQIQKRSEFLQSYQNDTIKIQQNNNSFEMWA